MPLPNPPTQRKVRVVLVETQGDANIGAVARAIACFGARSLYLVQPQAPVHETSYFWACHGREVLENRIVTDSLAEALRGVTLAIGTSARHGCRRHRMVTPKQLSEEVLPQFPSGEIALVFGNEESGLSNDHLKLCHRITKIATDPVHSSLNLSHTVSILLYEILGRENITSVGGKPKEISSPKQRQRLVEEVGVFLGERGYPSHNATLPEELIKLSDLVERSNIENWEVRFLLGMVRHLRNYEKRGERSKNP